ncbi:MAG: AraC family transcriptional regulator [Longimonas sp.]|uniref:helix-turn-helix transcriptional regulator n=1 Tax=Longimonas sp. TaxID=2039626 RepID=UPI0039758EE0
MANLDALEAIRAAHPPTDLIENRTTFGGPDAELSIYDTYNEATHVRLQRPHPLICGMIRGKKVMHIASNETTLLDASGAERTSTIRDAPFDFMPHETLVLPSGQPVFIDFPEAAPDAPTTCLTVEIDRDRVQQVVDRMNLHMPRAPESGSWTYDDLRPQHYRHLPDIDETARRLVHVFTEDRPYKDTLIDLGITELVVRLLRTEARALLLSHSAEAANSNGLAAAIEHVKQNLHRRITVDELAEAACMSTSSLYRYFRNEMGCTPLQFITTCRIRQAKTLLSVPDQSVTTVAYELGFSDVSHFIHTFRDVEGCTPGTYQQRHAPHNSNDAA